MRCQRRRQQLDLQRLWAGALCIHQSSLSANDFDGQCAKCTGNTPYSFAGDGSYLAVLCQLDINTVQSTFFPGGFIDGMFVITAGFTMNGGGFNNTIQAAITEATSGAQVDLQMESLDYPSSYSNGALNFMYEFRPSRGDDVPSFIIGVYNGDPGVAASGTATWTIVFYPGTQAIRYPS